MAEEKREGPTILSFISKYITRMENPQKMTENDGKYNTEICKKCGTAWCYKQWSMPYEMSFPSDIKKITLIESKDSLFAKAMLAKHSAMVPTGNSLDRAKRTGIYEPKIGKFIYEYTDRIYCYLRHIKRSKTNILDKVGYSFRINDDKILYLFHTEDMGFTGAIGQKYMYRLIGFVPYRLPLNHPCHISVNDEDFLTSFYNLFSTEGEQLQYKEIKPLSRS